MIKTLRESKAKLSELIDIASKGEDVLITVHGKVKAKLTKAAPVHALDMQAWTKELKILQTKYTINNKVKSEDILQEMREDRF